jgi:hypothetical protein
MPHDDAVSLFLAFLQDGKDPVNPSLPAVDDPRGYQDELEYAGDFIEKLMKRSVSASLKDDMDEPAREVAFTNPLGFAKGSVGFKLKVVRTETVGRDGISYARAYDASGRCVETKVLR